MNSTDDNKILHNTVTMTVARPGFEDLGAEGADPVIALTDTTITVEVTAPVHSAYLVNAVAHAADQALKAIGDTPDDADLNEALGMALATGERLRSGLRVIAKRGCESTTAAPGETMQCFTFGRFADAKYGADRACDPCIASAVLVGRELPTEPS